MFTNFLQSQVNLTLSNTRNIQYTGQIAIGSKNQPFDLIFDTAAPWLWVLPSSQKAACKSLFNCSDSSSCYLKQAGGHYETGTYWMFSTNQNIQGEIAWDNIAFDDSQPHLNQSFLILQNTYNNLIGGDSVDGVLGLSPTNEKKLPTIFDQLKSAGQIKERMFSLYLDDNIEAYEENDSQILFGGVDSTYYSGNFLQVRALPSYYWQTYLNSSYLSLGSNSITVKLSATLAVFDSGSDIIKMTPDDFTEFAYDLKAQFGISCSRDINRDYACQCPNGNISTFPNITLILDSQVLTITPSMYINVKSDSCILLIDGCLASTATRSTSGSLSANAPKDLLRSIDPTDYIILGSPFLRTYYTVFSADNSTIVFALAVHKQKTLISSLEMVYMAFGIFIMVMFVVLVGCAVKICTSKGKGSGRDHKIFDNSTLLEKARSDTPYYLAPSKD